jgi:hypothetical protein
LAVPSHRPHGIPGPEVNGYRKIFRLRWVASRARSRPRSNGRGCQGRRRSRRTAALRSWQAPLHLRPAGGRQPPAPAGQGGRLGPGCPVPRRLPPCTGRRPEPPRPSPGNSRAAPAASAPPPSTSPGPSAGPFPQARTRPRSHRPGTSRPGAPPGTRTCSVIAGFERCASMFGLDVGELGHVWLALLGVGWPTGAARHRRPALALGFLAVGWTGLWCRRTYLGCRGRA